MGNYYAIGFKKTIITSIFTCFFILFSFSQNNDDQKSSFWKNVQYGGGIGLNFGDGFFSGAIAPNALYRHSPYVATGVGLNFQYSSQRDIFKSTVLGASAVGLFNPYRELQISTEFEQLHVSRKFANNIDDNYWYPALFLGLGYTSGNITFGIRYDVLYDEDKSIQPEAWMPFVRFWF